MFYFLDSFKEPLEKISLGNHLFLPSRDGKNVFEQSKLIDFVIV